MLDKRKRSKDTCRDTGKESQMATSPKPRVEVESETEQVAQRISRDPSTRERIKLAIADLQKGRVISREEVIKKLKKHA